MCSLYDCIELHKHEILLHYSLRDVELEIIYKLDFAAAMTTRPPTGVFITI